MTQSRLPFPDLPTTPSDSHDEPDVWVRRLFLVEDINPPIRIIRRISLRRGLNIVCTERRTASDTQPVGHSVGKSLFVRIIRYCLGEDRFCTETQRRSITAQLEHAYALAIVRVNGQDWAVARPLGLESGYADSWCVRSSRLRDLLSKDERLKFRDFVDALDQATSDCYADIDLPRAARRTNWRDLLGWLSRDQDCHFDHHADWRASELQAGPRALTREDAYLVMRMALGLLGPEEIGLMVKHRELLAKRQQADVLTRQYQAYIEQTEERLRNALVELKDLPTGEVFGSAFVKIADEKIDSLDRLLGDPSILNRSELAELQEVYSQSLRIEGSLEAKMADIVTHEDATQEELTNAESQDAQSLLKTMVELRWKCSYFKAKDEAMEAGCPGKTMVDQGIADPWRKQLIEELQSEVAAIRRKKEEAETALADACEDTQEQRKVLAQKTSEFVERREDITREIGQWTARKDEANRYGSAWHDLDAIKGSRDARQKEIDDSSAVQRTVRAQFEKQKADLSIYYDAVLKRTISPNAEGRIEIDGDGIRPWTSDAVADSGATLREYADVLSFDLACLAASISGVGNLPRFWIHDSPRQADSEEQLYHSILRFISELEQACPAGCLPSFQYILTTTSAPPDELNCKPYVRMRLHARTDNGKLLRRSFGMQRAMA